MLTRCLSLTFALFFVAASPHAQVRPEVELVLVTGGIFLMGSPASEPERGGDEVQHRVRLSDFRIARNEVTQKEYLDLMGSNPSEFVGENLPVENVTWYDALRYCNALSLRGGRMTTAMHNQVAIDHGFAAIAPVDIMDEDGSISLPFPNGKNIKEDFVGAHFSNYDSFLVLSHFKGHAMGGFGGAIKNISIGISSSSGKLWIHSAGKIKEGSFRLVFGTPQDLFLESMAEAAGAVMNRLGDNIVYISVMNNLSVDCDCMSNPAAPQMDDIGILASLDPVALDKACVDLVYAYQDQRQSAALRERMESRHGIHTLEHAEALGLGSQKYELVRIDG